MLDRDGRIIYCNDYLFRLTGWTREEVSGRNWFDAVHAARDSRGNEGRLYLAPCGPAGRLAPRKRDTDAVAASDG